MASPPGSRNTVPGVPGEGLGLTEGLIEGDNDGEVEGEREALGETDGENEGDKLGLTLGEAEGLIDGDFEGLNEGEIEGLVEGEIEGEIEEPAAGLKEAIKTYSVCDPGVPSVNTIVCAPVPTVPLLSANAPAVWLLCVPPVLTIVATASLVAQAISQQLAATTVTPEDVGVL